MTTAKRVLFLSCNSIFGLYKILGNLIIQELNGKLQNIDIYSGCGTGILISTFLAMGYDIRDIITYFAKNLPVKDYFIEYGYASSPIDIDKLFVSDITLSDLYASTGNSLVIPVYDRILDDIKILNCREDYGMKIKDCLNIALSNPYYSDTDITSLVNVTMFPDVFSESTPVLSVVVTHKTQTLFEVKKVKKVRGKNLEVYILEEDEMLILDNNQIGKAVFEGYVMNKEFTDCVSDVVYKNHKNSIKNIWIEEEK